MRGRGDGLGGGATLIPGQHTFVNRLRLELGWGWGRLRGLGEGGCLVDNLGGGGNDNIVVLVEFVQTFQFLLDDGLQLRTERIV